MTKKLRRKHAAEFKSKRLLVENLEPRLALSTLLPVAGHWSGGQVDTMGLYDSAAGKFYFRNLNAPGFANTSLALRLQAPNVAALAGDFNGGGKDTAGLYSPANGTFLLTGAAKQGNTTFKFGPAARGDIPLAGDWDGNGADGVGVYDPATGTFYLKDTAGGGTADLVFALAPNCPGWTTATAAAFRPVAGDFNGDGRDTVGLLDTQTGTFYLTDDLASATIDHAVQFDAARGTVLPVAGSWTTGGGDSIGVYDPATGAFSLRNGLGDDSASNTFYVVPGLDPLAGVTAAARAATAPAVKTAAAKSATQLTTAPVSVMVGPLTAMEVQKLLDRASAASASQDAIIAVVDRAGRILGVRVEPGAVFGNPATQVFAIDGAVALARTAAFFANTQAPLTSRTVRFISQSTITQREVQSNPSDPNPASTTRGPGFVGPIGLGGHFPPEIAHTPPVDLFAIEHTNRDLTTPGTGRFNVAAMYGPTLYAPESYGRASGVLPTALARGIGTLPGGIPLFRNGELVGGIGVFFPGPSGYASYEQGFVPGIGQTEKQRTNAPRVLEAEWMAFAAAGGSSMAGATVGTINGVSPVPGFNLPFGRIDLVGIKLEIYGPDPGGPQTLLQVGRRVSPGGASVGTDVPVNPAMQQYIAGVAVPDGWLVTPHAGGGLTAADVTQIITQGITTANKVRAAIRLPLGSRTRMVLGVSDNAGNILGLFRMPDATIFSIDVAVAKARNTAYYANPALLQTADQIDDNNDSIPDVPKGVAFTNRTFRFVAEPRYPSGVDGSVPPDFSILRDPGINPRTAENLGAPLPATVYTGITASVLAHDAFVPGTNFRDPLNPQNQNGIVFFPGSTAIYKSTSILVGGFGVSGDGVDQDDVVTFYGSQGYQAPSAIRADRFFVRGVRLPYQKFNRNPFG